MPKNTSRPDNRSNPTKPRISPRSKRARKAASDARASVSMARDAVVWTVYRVAEQVIEHLQDGSDDILRAVINLLPPPISEAAARNLVLETVRLFAASLDRALTDIEEMLQREATAAEADFVERSRLRLQNISRHASYSLYAQGARVKVFYAGKTLQFQQDTHATTFMVLLLDSDNHSVSFEHMAETLWGTTDLSPCTLGRIRACKRALEKALIAAFGLPPNEARLDAPDCPKKQSWIVADREGSYSLNTRVLTWTRRSGEMSFRDRVCRADDLGRHLPDPKTLAPRTDDLDSPEDESDGEGSASGTDAMPHLAIDNSSSRASGAAKTTLPRSPSGTLPRRPTATHATGLRDYIAKRGRKASDPPTAS